MASTRSRDRHCRDPDAGRAEACPGFTWETLVVTSDPRPDSALRLAEVAGMLSLATDLAMGQPLEHGLRTTVLAVRVGAEMGLPAADLATVYYTGLLHFATVTSMPDSSVMSWRPGRK
jgi:hypothetical protein